MQMYRLFILKNFQRPWSDGLNVTILPVIALRVGTLLRQMIYILLLRVSLNTQMFIFEHMFVDLLSSYYG